MSGNIAALRLKNRMYAGALNATALQAELADAYQLGAWRQLCARGADMEQLLSVPELRAVIQASPAAADELLRSSYCVGRSIDALMSTPDAGIRTCNTLERLLADADITRKMMLEPAARTLLASSPWGLAKLRAAFQAYMTQPSGAQLLGAVIDSQPALDFVLSDAASAAALRGSVALPKVEVPAQNSSSNILGSGQYGSEYLYKAFDKTDSTWLDSKATNAWVSFNFGAPTYVHTVTVSSRYLSSQGVKNARVEASNDGNNWTTMLETQFEQGSSSVNLMVRYLSKAGRYTRWRLLCLDNWGGVSVTGVSELNFIGFQ